MSLNLLPSQAKFQMDKIRAKSLGRKIVSYFLAVWVIVVLIILSILWVENWWLSQLDKKYKLAVSDYLSLSQEIVVSQTIKFRTKLLAKVLNDRFEYSNAFETVGGIFDSNVSVKDFQLKDKSFFALSVTANNNEAVKQIESRVDEINLGLVPEIKKILIKTVIYSKADKSWLILLEVYLK